MACCRLAPRFSDWLPLGLGVMLLAGCGGGPKRLHLSGQILFDGRPVPVGEIYFDPDVSKGFDGPQGFARVKDGHYDTRQGGVPAAPGPYLARILGFDGKSRPDEELPMGRRLFPEHQAATTLPDQTEAAIDFAVPARGQAR